MEEGEMEVRGQQQGHHAGKTRAGLVPEGWGAFFQEKQLLGSGESQGRRV